MVGEFRELQNCSHPPPIVIGLTTAYGLGQRLTIDFVTSSIGGKGAIIFFLIGNAFNHPIRRRVNPIVDGRASLLEKGSFHSQAYKISLVIS